MTSSSDEKAEQVHQHLASLIKTDDTFQVINRKKHPKFNEEVDRLTNGEKADFIFEIGGIKTSNRNAAGNERTQMMMIQLKMCTSEWMKV
jgi:NADPH:quinone reductase-like Zn-dependent oxidoreductase